MTTIHLIQLPFPSLDYFPDDRYFRKMERWLWENVSQMMHVPQEGFWEPPPWISNLQAHLRALRESSGRTFEVNVVDLGSVRYNTETVLSHLKGLSSGDIALMSPLTQNSNLAKCIARKLKQFGVRTGIGGHATYLFSCSDDVAVFHGRIEERSLIFSQWLRNELGLVCTDYIYSDANYSRHYDLTWASKYDGQITYARFYTHHGCPFKCIFCADRNSRISLRSPRVINAELAEILRVFPSHDRVYIGDLTFGVHKKTLSNLRDAIYGLPAINDRPFIAQSNLALINETFVENLKYFGIGMLEIGLETANTVSAKVAKNAPFGRDDFTKRIEIVRQSGISVSSNILFGLPYENNYDYEQSLNYLRINAPNDWHNLYGLVPYHNTPIYKDLSDKNRIINQNLDEWCEGADLVFLPYHLSRAQVANYLREAINLVVNAML